MSLHYMRLNWIKGSGKKIDVLLSNTNTNPNPKINVVAMTKEHQFFYGTDTRGKPMISDNHGFRYYFSFSTSD